LSTLTSFDVNKDWVMAIQSFSHEAFSEFPMVRDERMEERVVDAGVPEILVLGAIYRVIAVSNTKGMITISPKAYASSLFPGWHRGIRMVWSLWLMGRLSSIFYHSRTHSRPPLYCTPSRQSKKINKDDRKHLIHSAALNPDKAQLKGRKEIFILVRVLQ
jgi:hypothetical protein